MIEFDPGGPWQNGYAESDNSRFRVECLGRDLLYTASESRVVSADWKNVRPNRSPGLQSPTHFARTRPTKRLGSGRPAGSYRPSLQPQQHQDTDSASRNPGQSKGTDREVPLGIQKTQGGKKSRLEPSYGYKPLRLLNSLESHRDGLKKMIHVYPAMGTTSAMYGPPWKEEIHGIFHDWPQWNGEATIGELAERIIEEHSIEDGDVLIGSSLGGMVAGEIARKRKLELVVLIGSAASCGEIRKSLGTLHPLIDFLPLSLVRACSGKLPSDLARMFFESEPEFVRAMIKAIFKWDGVNPSTRLMRIHGTRDLVIPPPEKVDLLIRGGHFIAMTHAGICIQKLKAEGVTGEHGADGPGRHN